jgi:arginase family enzyme
MNLKDLFFELMKRIKVKDAYVSIDKDCLNENHSLTNWESGAFELDQLLLLLKLIKDNLNIVGMDIAGDYSLVIGKSNLKAAIARLDHPKEYSANHKPDELITSINEQTNIKILQSLA